MLNQIRLQLSINACHQCGCVAKPICGYWANINNPINILYEVAAANATRTRLLRNGAFPC